ncbi:hypothetical protein CRUP_030357 [Coryphaenoides rupestris]|nr:hypothetical protein CRUP_030357 [Coryphaenoides rupestris]
MIKEAPEDCGAKPKVAAAEKENNPLKTPEALPEAKKTEYRMLREEIMSREKQRQQKEASHSPHGSGSPAVSDTEPDASSKASAELQVSAAQKRLTKHRLEEEDLSEMQLRLLALQSASKKWQQKEQEVMKESKERNTTTTKACPGQEFRHDTRECFPRKAQSHHQVSFHQRRS